MPRRPAAAPVRWGRIYDSPPYYYRARPYYPRRGFFGGFPFGW